MKNLTLREINDLKRDAEANIASVVNNVFEKFKQDTGITHANQSIDIRMEYVQTMGHRKAEAVVGGVDIRMEVFD